MPNCGAWLAASKLQSVYRGHKSRRQFDDITKHHHNATRLQAAFRGHRGRSKAHEEIQSRQQRRQRDEFVTRVQVGTSFLPLLVTVLPRCTQLHPSPACIDLTKEPVLLSPHPSQHGTSLRLLMNYATVTFRPGVWPSRVDRGGPADAFLIDNRHSPRVTLAGCI